MSGPRRRRALLWSGMGLVGLLAVAIGFLRMGRHRFDASDMVPAGVMRAHGQLSGTGEGDGMPEKDTRRMLNEIIEEAKS